jgi:hypothetical protein
MRALAALVSSVFLPTGVNYSAVAPSQGITVLGTAVAGAACLAVHVDPVNMRSGGARRVPCRELYAPGRSIVPAITWYVHGSNDGLMGVGSVHVRFGDYSDTKPEWAYGGGSLWLYDVATTRGPLLLRFSAQTGRLLRTIRMPRVFRPVLAANDDGLWLGVAPNGGAPGRGKAPVYHVAPAAGGAVVIHREGRGAFWLVARGHTVWAALVSGTTRTRLWRFEGPKARATLLNARAPAVTSVAYGAGALTGIASTARCAGVRVVRLDAATGKSTTVATVPSLGVCGDGAAPAYAGGALYFLNGPKLFRVRLPRGARP